MLISWVLTQTSATWLEGKVIRKTVSLFNFVNMTNFNSSLYNLTAALYFETQTDQYSSVVTVVHQGSKYKSFESLRGARACIPEFGGTASMAFVNVGKSRGFLDRKECRYGLLMSRFFGESCAPGAKDFRHHRTSNVQSSLCSLCKSAVTENPVQYRSRSDVNITGTPSTGESRRLSIWSGLLPLSIFSAR